MVLCLDIRAYKDAADWAYDSGEVIEGTKSATADDFVTYDEFRVSSERFDL